MNTQIKIRVLSLMGADLKEVYRNTISTENSLTFDFQRFTEFFKVLYPKANIIEFSVIV